MAAATVTALAAGAALALAFCLCLNVGLCRTISPASKPVRLQVIPRDSPQAASSARSASFLHGLTENDRLRRAIRRSHARASAIHRRVHGLSPAKLGQNKAAANEYQAPVSPGSGAFLLQLSIGSPSLNFKAILDTASYLTWTQCRPCVNCYNQTTPIFDPSTSTTYNISACDSAACKSLPKRLRSCDSKNQCNYAYSYGNSSNTTGVLATDIFTLSGISFVDIVFGCGHSNTGQIFRQAAGVVGFGRGALSLPSQYSKSVGADGVSFAYCLVSTTNGSSPLWLGPDTASKLPNGVKPNSTALILNNAAPTFYYVSVTGIDVAGIAVDIPDGALNIKANGSGGVIVDSGTTLTYLETEVYNNLISALKSAIKLSPVDGSSSGLGLCYNASSVLENNVGFPTVTLTFYGGAQLQWTAVNYLVQQDDLVCATLVSSSGISVIGNLAQIDQFVLYDTSASTISFVPTQCDSL